jgi:hypothetical protein
MDAAAYASTIFDHCSHSALAKRNISDDILAEDADVPPVTTSLPISRVRF